MKRKRDLLITNLLSLLILLAALLAGWREAAAFGSAVLVVMDVLVVIRERFPRLSLHSRTSPSLPAEENQGAQGQSEENSNSESDGEQ
jgi:hypothetical protein